MPHLFIFLASILVCGEIGKGGEALGSYYCHQCNFHKGKLMKLGGKTDLHKCKTKIVENSPLPLIHFPGKGEGKMRKEYANEI